MKQNKGDRMKWLWIIVGLTLASSMVQAQQVTKIDNEQLSELLKNPELQLVDVRTSEEVSYGIIENALVIDFYDSEFVTKISRLDREKPIVVYCAVGGRSAKTGSKLSKLGFKKIYDLKGGFRGWKKEDRPIVSHKLE